MTSLHELPSVPESVLPPELLAALPSSVAPAPWECRVRATVWFVAGRPLGDGLPVSVGALVQYFETPVGPYREVFAGQLVPRVGWPTLHVPFMAVDSLPSVLGGRANWALPKVLAEFDGDIAGGDGWAVSAVARAHGPSFPLRARFALSQEAGVAPVHLRGRGRVARVFVDAAGPTLREWLGRGSRVGVVGEGVMTIGAPVQQR